MTYTSLTCTLPEFWRIHHTCVTQTPYQATENSTCDFGVSCLQTPEATTVLFCFISLL